MAGTEAQRAAVAVLAAALALAVGGCLGSNSDKAGGAQHQKPVVLTMANSNGFPLELGPFAAAVARLSNHTIRIEFKNDWRKGAPSYETGMIGDVKAGKADLGSAGSRAFDSVGVPTFDALHAPLLIDSYALEQRVLESPLVGDMLDGLKPLGVIGLGILPGQLHKPLGVSRLVRPADYRGKTIAISRSRVARETLRALGASTKEIPFGGGIGALDGIEQEVGAIEATTTTGRQEPDGERQPLAATAGPVHQQKAFAALSDTQRDALRAAARSALPATMAIQRGGEKEGAATRCRRGVRFVTASDTDLARSVRRSSRYMTASSVTGRPRRRSSRSARCDPARPFDCRRAEVLQDEIDDERRGQGHANRRGVPHDDDAEGSRESLRRRTSEIPPRRTTVAGGSCLIGGGSTTRSPARARAAGRRPSTPSRATRCLAGHRLRWRGSQRRG